MAEDTDRESGQLPGFPGRNQDEEQLEQAARRERRLDWLPEAILLVMDVISSWP
jgi:hypothetical protein